MGIAAAAGLEKAQSGAFTLRVCAEDPEQHGPGRQRGGKIRAVPDRRVAVENLLQSGPAKPGSDQRGDTGSDRAGRQQDDAGDGKRGNPFDLVDETGRQPGVPLCRIADDRPRRIERIMGRQHRQILRRKAGGEKSGNRGAEMVAVGERGDCLAQARRRFG